MFNADQYWITVAEVKGFSNAAHRVLTPAEWDALTEYISILPDRGDVISDCSGLRVVRWPAASQGKNGHIRVVYYFRDLNTPVYLLALYEKGERLYLTSGEKRIIRELIEEIVSAYGIKWAERLTSPGAA
jgi:hypothetical protein